MGGDRDPTDHYYQEAIHRIREELNGVSFADLEANGNDELVEYFLSKTALGALEEDPERPASTNPAIDPGEYRRTSMQHTNLSVLVEVPLVPKDLNSTALQLRASREWPLSPNLDGQASFREKDHVLELRVPMEHVVTKVELAKRMLSLLNEEIRRYTPHHQSRVEQAVRTRRVAAESQADKFDQRYAEYEKAMASMGVVVRRKPDSVEPVNVLVKKSIQVLRRAPRASAEPAEPYLMPEALMSILGLVDQAGKGFEKAPGSFGKLGEEDLRMVILGFLNAVFATSAATGETFSKTGKADILLNTPDGPVLVAECLYWDGPDHYSKKIAQLFGYLTWRHTAGILITFSKNKGLTRVIEQADDAIQAHPSFRDGFAARTSTHHVSIHEHPDDERKRVELHHLFFNLHSDW